MADDKVKIVVEGEDKASHIFDNVGRSLSGLGTIALGVAGVGLAALAAGVAGVGLILKETVPIAADFQSSMANLQIAAGDASLSLDQLHDVSLQIGGDTTLLGVNASQAAESLTGLYKAGLTTTEIFGDVQGFMAGTVDLGGAMRAAIDLAAASQLDMVQASDLAAVALATFGGELETEAERAGFVTEAMDFMVRAADASVAEVGDLSAALTNVGPIASALGISFEDVNTALAVLSTRGIEGSQAGTALKSMLTNLQRPTKEVQKAYADLGVTMYDTQGAFVGLPNLVEQLQGALFGASEVTVELGGRTAEQNDQLERAQDRYGALTQRIADHNAGIKIMSETSLKKANEELANSSAVMEALAGITGTTTTATRQLTQEQRNQYIQTLAGTFGMNALNTLLAEGVEGWDGMTEAIGAATGIQEQAAIRTATFAGRMEALSGALETVKIEVGEAVLPLLTDLVNFVAERGIPIVERFVEPWTRVWEWLGHVFDLITEHGFTFRDLFAILEDGSSVVSGFFTALGFSKETANELGATINSVVNFVADLVTWIGNAITAVRDFLEPVTSWISENIKLQDILLALGAILVPVIIPAVIALAQAIGGILLAAAPGILAIGALIGVFALLRTAWEENWHGIRDTLTEVWESTIQPAIQQLQEWLQINIPIAIEALKGYWEEVLLPAMRNVWAWIEENLIPVLGDIWERLQINLPLAIETLRGFLVEVLLPALQTVWGWITGTLIPLFIEWEAWKRDRLTDAITILSDFWLNVLQPAIQTVWGWIVGTLIPTLSDVWIWLKNTLTNAITILSGFWLNNLLPALTTIWDFIENYVIPVFLGISDVMSAILSVAITVQAGLWQNIFKPALEAVWNFIKFFLQVVFDGLVVYFNLHLQPALAAAVLWWDAFKVALEPIKGFLQGITNWLGKVADAIRAIPDHLPGWMTPGSPTPFELGLMGINDALELVTPNLKQFNQQAGAMGNNTPGIATGALAGGGATVNHNYYIQANYPFQDERSLAQDIRVLQMLRG